MKGAVGIINLNQLVPSKDDYHIQEHTGVGFQQSLSSPLSYFHSLELLLEAPIALGKRSTQCKKKEKGRLDGC